MITLDCGDIFESGCEAFVIPVNCGGVHGKGLALEAVKRFPWLRSLPAPRMGEVSFHLVSKDPLSYLVQFPTKHSWRDPKSDFLGIISGLGGLRVEADVLGVKSIAIPHIGCGCGRLHFQDVFLEIFKAFNTFGGKVRVLHSGHAPDFQSGYTGSIPVTRSNFQKIGRKSGDIKRSLTGPRLAPLGVGHLQNGLETDGTGFDRPSAPSNPPSSDTAMPLDLAGEATS